MGTGMGMPSESIYATELIREYGAGTLIRIGSCGALRPGLALRDLIVVTGASTDSNINRLRFGGHDFAAVPDFGLTRALVEAAERRGVGVRTGTVLSSDAFYHPRPEILDLAGRLGMLAVEMEAAGLFGVAAEHGARAAAILTVSDTLPGDEHMNAAERESSLDGMAVVALEAITGGGEDG
jgi:purine-nucleoside phosphorylase